MKPLLIDEVKNVIRAELKTPLHKGLVTGVRIDSRQVKEGDVFVALRGEHFDGHDFIGQALQAGARAIVVERNIPLSSEARLNGVVVMKVDSSIEALGRLAWFYRRQCGSVSVIAVTGSNGKTTVREMIYHVLHRYKEGIRSPRNFNNNIGVPITLFQLESEHEFAVVEMGSNAPGEIAMLSRMVEPDVAVITSVGPSHLAGLKDIDGVSREKVSIVSGLKHNGLIICGIDHPPTLERIQSLGRHVVTFGLDRNCDVYAEDIRREGQGIRFRTNDRYEIILPMAGQYNVANALAALAVVRRLGITSRQFAQAMQDFQPVPGRMNIKEINGITIIDDCYNANPLSMAVALKELANFRHARRRVLVCGDMNELGADSEKYHRQLGRDVVAAGVDLLFTVGAQAAQTAEEAIACGMGKAAVMRCINSRRMARLIKSMLFNGDVVLVKGSRAMEMEKVVVSLERWKGR